MSRIMFVSEDLHKEIEEYKKFKIEIAKIKKDLEDALQKKKLEEWAWNNATNNYYDLTATSRTTYRMTGISA